MAAKVKVKENIRKFQTEVKSGSDNFRKLFLHRSGSTFRANPISAISYDSCERVKASAKITCWKKVHRVCLTFSGTPDNAHISL